ncbi:hypothetical protein B9Z19DRAFT_1067955 [Tuber borchii]|uniref:Uncharacterized protein n=1 Tax=Tuber borchii TaxID=42251 RepID=A0A2T6ZHA0_TUBBO|nr:hypothetical protein B9Z19DRAFT_1067955 [Tuber borchii]
MLPEGQRDSRQNEVDKWVTYYDSVIIDFILLPRTSPYCSRYYGTPQYFAGFLHSSTLSWPLGSDICPATFAYSSLIPKARPMLDLQGLGLRVSSAAPWPDSAYAPNSGKSSQGFSRRGRSGKKRPEARGQWIQYRAGSRSAGTPSPLASVGYA